MNPKRVIQVLSHDCVTMLQTRFVLFTGSVTIRRHSITNFLLDDEHGLLSLPGGSCTAREVFMKLNFTNRSFGKMCENSVPASWLASELTLISSYVFSFGSTTSCSTTTVCVGGVHQRGLLRKVTATLESYATGLPVPGHLGIAIGPSFLDLKSMMSSFDVAPRPARERFCLPA